MKKVLALVALSLCLVGCQTGQIHVDALEPALNPVVNEYEKYIAAGKKPDGTALSDNAKQVRIDSIKRLRALITAAKANKTAGQ